MKIGTHPFDFERPYIVGILNVTPDSFSDGGMYLEAGRAVERGLALAREGADIIDVGGESTRPGSDPISADEEKARVLPVIRSLSAQGDVPLSIDTAKADVAEAALAEGACLVNDVSGLRGDPGMARVAARAAACLIVMHSRGTPRDMQQRVRYEDLHKEISGELARCMEMALEAGVEREKIIVDPGIGFAKGPAHNLRILGSLGFLEALGRPILVGPSRKSFIGAVTGAPVEDRLGGTAAAVAAAVLAGAHFIRVHDVHVMRQAALVAHAIRKAGKG